MKKWFLTLLLFVVSSTVFADGKVFRKGTDTSFFIPVAEEFQHAIIAHKDGQEAMLLAVNFNLEDDEKAFWLFPVCGKPEDVKADIFDVFPRIRGIKPSVPAKEKFEILFGAQLLSQPYTWPYFFCVMPALRKVGTPSAALNVHSVVEKYGLRTEILTAESTNSLSGYLRGKEINIEESELTAFSDYLNDQYSLVFVEISSKEELLKKFPDYEQFQRVDNGRWPCVFVEFPSEKFFFPLKATGSYEERIGITIKVLEPVRSEKELSEDWFTGYYLQTNMREPLPDILKAYVTENPVCYTSFVFNGDAPELRDDLWMVPFEPKGVKYARFIDGLARISGGYVIIMLGVLLFLFQSWMCAGLTGLVFFRKWHPYAILGLGNIVTLLGVYFLAKYGRGFLKTEFYGDEKKPESFRLHKYGKKETKRTWFLLLFSFLFMLSSVILYFLFTLPFYGT